jgi:hypothetical protein
LAIWTWKNRNARCVKASQPFFLILICVGTFVAASAAIPSTVDLSVASSHGCAIA